MFKKQIIHLPETNSTNACLIDLIKTNHPDEGTVVLAEYQTAGRGMDDNLWESEKGKNLTFSLLLYPPFTADKQFILNKAISTGISDFLTNELSGNLVRVKWPNDIYIKDKKVCGMLIQNSITGVRFDYSVVGIGLNVNQMAFLSDAPNPVSMKMVTGIEYPLPEILDNLLASIAKRYQQVCTGFQEKIENDYQSVLYRLGEWHNFDLQGVCHKARITGTNEYGQLLLETEDGKLRVYDVKEVKFVI